MYWKKPLIIKKEYLINMLNVMEDMNEIYKCQSITNNNYCNYIHKWGKNKNLICGTVSKNGNGRCFTHSRNNSEKTKFKKIIIKKFKYNKTNTLKWDSIQLINTPLFDIFYHVNNSNIFMNERFSIFKTIFFFTKDTYNLIKEILLNNYNFDKNKNVDNILQIKNTEENVEHIENTGTIKKRKKNRSKKKIRKIIKVKEEVDSGIITEKIVETLESFEEIRDYNEVYITSKILFDENKTLFKLYINIILSNINFYFKNVNMDLLLNIWKDTINYVKYEKVLIYSDDNNLIKEVFGYVRCNYELIPKHIDVLWVNNNSIVPYDKKYVIDKLNAGIKIYNKNDTKKEKPLNADVLTILYY